MGELKNSSEMRHFVADALISSSQIPMRTQRSQQIHELVAHLSGEVFGGLSQTRFSRREKPRLSRDEVGIFEELVKSKNPVNEISIWAKST